MMGRNQNEPPMTCDFWRRKGGTLILEFPLVRGELGSSRREADGLIVVGGHFECVPVASTPDLHNRSVLLIQTKADGTDAALLGQVLLSEWLLRRRHPEIRSIQSVMISTASQPFFASMLADRGVIEEVQQPPPWVVPHIHLRGLPESDIDALHERRGGELLRQVPLRPGPGLPPLLTAPAVLVAGGPTRRRVIGRHQQVGDALVGQTATAVITTDARLGMYAAGFAIAARQLLIAQGAKVADAVVLVSSDDLAIHWALDHFPGISVEIATGTSAA